MKKSLVFAVLFTAGILSAFELGKPCTIYYEGRNAAAANELSKFMTRIYNQKFPVNHIKRNKDGKGIFIAAKKPSKLVEAEVKGDRLDIYGNNVQFAVADFLERECGVRFLWPGELGTVIPKGKVKTLADGYYGYQPQFSRRLSHSFHYPARYMNIKDRNDLNTWQTHNKIGLELKGGFGHAFARLVPQEKYAKDHPEYFSLVSPANWVGGSKPDKPTRKTTPGCWQLCTSNDEVRQIIAEKLASNPTTDIQSISPNDGGGFCECDKCKTQDYPLQEQFPLTNRMYDFLADVANRVKKLNPKTKIGLFSYSYFAGVPSRKVQLPDNCYLSLCYIQVEQLTPAMQKELDDKIIGLGKLGAKIVGREYWGTHYYQNMPIDHSRLIAHNINLLSKYGAAGIYGEPCNNFAIRPSDNYILAKLSWNPALKRDDILKDFCKSAFGEAADLMFEYFDSGEKEFWKQWTRPENWTRDIMKHFPSMYANRLKVLSMIFNKKWADQRIAMLRKAKAKAKLPEEKARIDFIISGVNIALSKSELNEQWSLAVNAGIQLPLMQPSSGKVRMEKNNLLKIVNGILHKNYRHELIMGSNNNGNCVPGIGFLREYSVTVRPWKTVCEMAKLDLASDRYNFLVNGSFEFRQWEWDIKGTNGFKSDVTGERNCDEKTNFIAQCHLNQGLSLKLEIPANGSVTITNTRPVESDIPANLRASMFVRGNAEVKADFNDKAIETRHVNAGLEEDSWQELRFTPLAVKPGKYTFRAKFINNTNEVQTIFIDNIQVMIKP